MPVQARGKLLLDLPEPPSLRRRVQGGRRSWLLFSLALATAFALAGWLTEPAVLVDPLARYVLAAAFTVGLLLISFPLSAGLPLLAGFFALTISLLVQAGPFSPLQPVADPVQIRPLYLEEAGADGSRMELQLWTLNQIERLTIELEGNAYRLVWYDYSISPWYILLRNRALVPAAVQSAYVSHLDPDVFSVSGEARLNTAHEFPPWIKAETSDYYGERIIPRLQRTVTHHPGIE